MSLRSRLSPWLLLLAVASACSAPGTDTVVRLRVTSDLELSGVHVLVRTGGLAGSGPLDDERWLPCDSGARPASTPVTTDVRRPDPDTRWVEFHVTGHDPSGNAVADRQAWASFIDGTVVELAVHLGADCAYAALTCPEGRQCVDGACRPPDPPPGIGCGNAVAEPDRGEQCDDGNGMETDACRSNCRHAACGDGVTRQDVEQCDDGNEDDHDACTTACTTARCGDGILFAGAEECDDGNEDDHDACTTACTIARCGDGILFADVEQCDLEPAGTCTTPCGSTGTRSCAACRWSCAPPAETCNGADDDCDTRTDEDFECPRGSTSACTTACGTAGSAACSPDCEPLPCLAPEETCNGVDDDCDTACDEAFACCLGAVRDCRTSCDTPGTQSCGTDCTYSTCTPPDEVCNGVDDDCDTRTDEPHPCRPGQTVACTTSCGTPGSGVCSTRCELPSAAACLPPPEVCNGADDDCDGVTDEVAGPFHCGDGCCNGHESQCSCPADCGPAPFLPPTPVGPENGTLTGGGTPPPDDLRPRLRWAAAEGGCGPKTYDVQLDDSCTVPGFAACTFTAPVAAPTGLATLEWRPAADLLVSAVAPVGRRYFWRVRACDAIGNCSDWSPVRYLDVGRTPGDFNGDGYADLTVGAPRQNAGSVEEGVVYVYDGRPAGPADTPTLVLDNPTGISNTHFGEALAAAGDLNGDGFADLAVGQPDTDTAVPGGRVHLFLGSAAGLPTLPSLTLYASVPETGAGFGRALAGAGDVNADGFADLIVGAPDQDSGVADDGSAYVFLGSTSGVDPDTALRLWPPDSSPGANYGAAVASAGDIDRDGYADVLVGTPDLTEATVYSAAAYYYRGGPAGVSTVEVRLGVPDSILGVAVASCDPNADGFRDLLVGLPRYGDLTGVVGGAIAVFAGGPFGIPAAPTSLIVSPDTQADARFGQTLACGDLDGDGYDDLAAAAPQLHTTASDVGRAYVFPGSASGLPDTPSVVVACPGESGWARFGTAIAVLHDVDGDGYRDLAVGTGNYSLPTSRGGAVFLYHSGPAGPPATHDRAFGNPLSQPAGAFGSAIAALFRRLRTTTLDLPLG